MSQMTICPEAFCACAQQPAIAHVAHVLAIAASNRACLGVGTVCLSKVHVLLDCMIPTCNGKTSFAALKPGSPILVYVDCI